MMRTGSVVRNAAAVGLGPDAPPSRAVALLAVLLMVALAVTGLAEAGGTAGPAVPGPGGTAGPAVPGPGGTAGPASAEFNRTAGAEVERGGSAGLGRAVPLRIEIAAIDVDARIAPLSLSEAGLVTVPAPQLVGWYRGGPSPGELGSAVLLGLLEDSGSPGAATGAFGGLERLTPGDHIEVERADGIPARFRVEAVEPYSPVRADHGGRGESQLRLVGLRGPVSGGAPELVVFASLRQ